MRQYTAFREFAENFALEANDLILTNSRIYDPVISMCGSSHGVIFRRNTDGAYSLIYGAPTRLNL